MKEAILRLFSKQDIEGWFLILNPFCFSYPVIVPPGLQAKLANFHLQLSVSNVLKVLSFANYTMPARLLGHVSVLLHSSQTQTNITFVTDLSVLHTSS